MPKINDATALRLGTTPILKAYAGSVQVWPAPGLPKIATLTDDFAASLDKAGKWISTSAATVWDASGRAKIPVTTSYWNLATNSVGTYDPVRS